MCSTGVQNTIPNVSSRDDGLMAFPSESAAGVRPLVCNRPAVTVILTALILTVFAFSCVAEWLSSLTRDMAAFPVPPPM